MIKYFGFLFAIVIVLSACSKKVDTVDDIISKYAEKLGGKEKIAKLKGMHLLAEMKMTNSPIVILNVTIFKPDKFKMDIEVFGQKYIQCINGNSGWSSQPGIGITAIQGDTLALRKQSMETQYKFLNNPIINFKENGLKVSLIGKEDVNGKSAYKILSVDKKGDSTYIFFDETDFTEVKNKVILPGPENTKVKMEFYFEDFKSIDGFNYPHLIIGKQDGIETSRLTIKKIEILDSIDQKLFEMPTEKSSDTAATAVK